MDPRSRLAAAALLLLALAGAAHGQAANAMNARNAASSQAIPVEKTDPDAACVATKITVAKPIAPAKKALDTAFDASGVEQHFTSLAQINDFRSHTESSYSCVDSRGEVNALATPGGDFAELAGAIQAYFDLTGTKKVDQAEVDKIFKAFMDEIATPERPFYYHTADDKLRKAFHTLEKEGVKPKPTAFPETMPADQEEAEKWLDVLSKGAYQGCGHVRLMISNHTSYGLASPDLPRSLVKAFYNYWWPTPKNSPERAKSLFVVKQGPLDAKAIAAVESKGACAGHSPAVSPSHGGSQIFLYHGQAVDDFRKSVLVPFLVRYGEKNGKPVDPAKLANAIKSVQAQHLGSTLKMLDPANAVPLWPVSIVAETKK